MSCIIGAGVQFGVTPVSQTQKAGLYSLTADTDTWFCMYMYRPDENRWTDTDEQHMPRIQTVFPYRLTHPTIANYRACFVWLLLTEM